MSELSDLIDACVESPDDDAPRLVWADAVGGERGELVMIQCALARGGLPPAETARLRRRQRVLIDAHGAEWSGLRGIAQRAAFQRGFVEAAEIDCGRLVAEADDIFARAPLLRSLTATGLRTDNDAEPVALPRLQALFDSPWSARLQGLFLDRPEHVRAEELDNYSEDKRYEFTSFAGAAFEYAASRPSPPRWRALGIRSGGGLRQLARSGLLERVERLWPHDYCSTDELLELLDPTVTPALVAIDFGDINRDFATILPRLPTGLRELDMTLLAHSRSDETLALLASSPCAARLERLAIGRCWIAEDAAFLHSLPRLRSLAVGEAQLSTPGVPDKQLRAIDKLLSAPLPSLRELVPFHRLVPEGLRALLTALGPQLEYVAADGTELEGLVAGEVYASVPGRVSPKALMTVGGDAPGPWMENVCV